MKDSSKYITKEYGERVEYAVTSVKDDIATLHPIKYTWVVVEVSPSELADMTIVGELSEEELKCDFTKNDLYS